MKVINHDEEDNKQIFLLIGGVILFVIIIAVIIFLTRRSPENPIEPSETETAAISTESVSLEKDENTEETEAESEIGTENHSTTFPIEKREEFIDPILGLFAGKVNEAVEGFVFQNNLAANGAECLDCAVAADNPSNTEFYLQLNDAAGTLVTARYSPDTNGVTVTNCVYSLDEIKQEIWMTDGGPQNRDTTEEPIQNIQTMQGKTIQGTVGEPIEDMGEYEGDIIENIPEDVEEDATEYITEYIIEEETEIY